MVFIDDPWFFCVCYWGKEKTWRSGPSLNIFLLWVKPLTHETITLFSPTDFGILFVDFSRNLSWKDRIFFLFKKVAKRLNVPRMPRCLFKHSRFFCFYREFITLYGVNKLWSCFTHIKVPKRRESRVFRSINCNTITDSLQTF